MTFPAWWRGPASPAWPSSCLLRRACWSVFLPGDSLLITAGIFAARGAIDITVLCVVLSIAAVAGDATGYWIGKRAGAALYNRPESFWFRRKHLLGYQGVL